MSNFTVNGVYSYNSSNIYLYLGKNIHNERSLKDAFNHFNIRPTGSNEDLKKLDKAIYQEYTAQVQEQIDNQNKQNEIPWAGVCAQIGIQATGDYNTDFAAFNNAIQLLTQSAYDGQAMTYFAGLKTEASRAFAMGNNNQNEQPKVSFYEYESKYLY